MSYVDFEFIGRNAIVSTEDVGFTFEAAENPRDFNKYKTTVETLDWTDRDYQLGNYNVYPYGTNNDLPKVIKDTVHENYIAPGILKKKAGLLWGKGPKLYTEEIVGGELVRNWVEDREIETWMEDWDAESYIQKAVVDTQYAEGHFTKFYQARGYRLGKSPKFAKLEHMNMDQCRLAVRNTAKNKTPTHCIYSVDQLERMSIMADYKVYPLMDIRNPFDHQISVMYSNMYSFCSEYYTVPDIFGSLEWIRRSSSIPLIFKALSKNSMNIKYHVISPQMFWDKQEERLKRLRQDKGETYTDQDLIDFKKAFLKKIADTLSNIENTGKFWHSTKHFIIEGNNLLEQGWEIKPIDQKIKDFVNAQQTISNIANRSVSAGLGVHQALGGSGEPGKTDGGGEQLYAYKNYQATSNDIPESIALKPLNLAIKGNWPEKKKRLGFYRITPKREQDINSQQRMKENV